MALEISGIELIYIVRLILRDNSKVRSELSLVQRVQLIGGLFLIDIGNLSPECQRMIVLLTSDTSYKYESLRVTAKQKFSEKSMFMTAKEGKPGYIKLTSKGFTGTITTLRKVLMLAGWEPKDYINEEYLRTQFESSRQNLSSKEHAQGILTSMVYAALTLPLTDGAISVKKEFNYSKWNDHLVNFIHKSQKEVVSDAFLRPSGSGFGAPAIALEIDRGTEHTGVLVGKVFDYAGIFIKDKCIYNRNVDSYQYTPAANRADVCVIPYPKDGVISNIPAKTENENQKNLQKLMLHKDIAMDICMIDAMLGAYTHIYADASNHKVAEFTAWIRKNMPKRNDVARLKKCRWYRILTIIEEFADENGNILAAPAAEHLLIKDLPATISILRSKYGNKAAGLLTYKSEDDIYKLANSIYQEIVKKFNFYETFRYNHFDTFGGMSVTCQPLGVAWKHIQLTYAGHYMRRHLENIVVNMGLLPTARITAEPMVRPIVEHDRTPVLSCRNAFLCQHKNIYNETTTLRICIEDISTDIAGLMRAQKFLTLADGSAPYTVMIALVNDNSKLATGEDVQTIWSYYRGTERIFIGSGAQNAFARRRDDINGYSEALHVTGKDKRYPLAFKYRMEIVFLTYSQFLQAVSRKVLPWIPITSDRYYVGAKVWNPPEEYFEIHAPYSPNLYTIPEWK